MASVSVSHLILFIASIVVAASVVGTFTSEVNRLSSAIGDQGVDVSEDVRTNIEIISDPGSEVYDRNGNGNITLLVKNTGSQNLPADAGQVDVLVNGEYQTNVGLKLVDTSADEWERGSVARLNVSTSLSPGDHRVKVIVNGDEEVFEFRT
jgi:flagellar protein FlaG